MPNNNAIHPIRSCPEIKRYYPAARCFVVVDGNAVPFDSYLAAGEWLQRSGSYRLLDDVIQESVDHDHKQAEAERLAYIESLNA